MTSKLKELKKVISSSPTPGLLKLASKKSMAIHLGGGLKIPEKQEDKSHSPNVKDSLSATDEMDFKSEDFNEGLKSSPKKKTKMFS